MLNGYDISDNQGDIDNTQVPGDFVLIKATEGNGYTDPNCDANYQQALGAGKKVGVYHFARPDGNGAAAEATWFASQTVGYRNQAVFALDMETQPITVAWVKEFCDTFFSITGIRIWIYMNQSTANSQDWSPVWDDYALWLAVYGNNIPQNGYTPSMDVSVNGNWTIAAWQYTSKGRLPGWGGFLDLDVFYGNRDVWDKYAKKVAPPVIPEQPPVSNPVPIDPPVVPPISPVETPPVPPIVIVPPKGDTPFVKSMLELLRIGVFALPGLLIQILTNDPALAFGYGIPVLGALKSIDKYLHENPDIKLTGLLPF